MPPVLEVVDVGKAFPSRRQEFRALEGVTFSCAEGELVSLVGPSGCGKSTLLHIIAGLEQPSAGCVLVDGRPVTGPGPERVVVFQRDTTFPWLRVEENVLFGATLRANRNGRRSQAAARERCDALLELVGLAPFRRSYPRQLSGGMRQRVALARALMCQPRLLLMDEPFGALDAQTREEMQGLLLAVCARQRTTVLFVTHDVEEAVYLSDRVLVMGIAPGRIVAEVEVPLPRPRPLEVKLEAAFNEVRREVLGLLYQRARRDSFAASLLKI
jgi:NitT/TauT family transport system ATP-binding protein